ncbi:MAG: hypothetical protein ACKOFI_06805, partial [Phycisphaerales bacterium]
AEALESRAGRAGVRPAFVVLLAGPGVDGAAILKAQNEAIFRAAGVGGDVLAQVVASPPSVSRSTSRNDPPGTARSAR